MEGLSKRNLNDASDDSAGEEEEEEEEEEEKEEEAKEEVVDAALGPADGVLTTILPSLLSVTRDSRKLRTCMSGDFIAHPGGEAADSPDAAFEAESAFSKVPFSLRDPHCLWASLIPLRKFCNPPALLFPCCLDCASRRSLSFKSDGEYLSANPWQNH